MAAVVTGIELEEQEREGGTEMACGEVQPDCHKVKFYDCQRIITHSLSLPISGTSSLSLPLTPSLPLCFSPSLSFSLSLSFLLFFTVSHLPTRPCPVSKMATLLFAATLMRQMQA